MITKSIPIFIITCLVWFCAASVSWGQATGARMGRFPDVDVMEERLVKGLSTKAEVEALLGAPSGRGGALSNLEPDRPREIWVYEENNVSIISMDDGAGRMRLHFAQQFLMVYFVEGVFDGFWWHDTAGTTPVERGSGG